MSRSLLAEKPIKPPKELKKFFDDPPLVGDERREDYENLFATLAMTVKPADAIEWMYLGDVVKFHVTLDKPEPQVELVVKTLATGASEFMEQGSPIVVSWDSRDVQIIAS